MKTCFICNTDKPLSEFYKHPKMGDGHLGKCKECTKEYVHKHRKDNLGWIQEYDRKRGQDPERQARNRANYRKRISTPEGRAAEWARAAEFRRNRAVERAANVLVGNAIVAGRLKKKPCEWCGVTDKTEGHHEDYGKPLEVVWLCKPCHGKRHRQINEERRRNA